MPAGKGQRIQMVCSQVLHLARLLNRITNSGATQTALLRALAEEDGLSVPQLARLSNTSRQNVQIMMDRLQKRGWVDSSVNPAHKRSPLYRITSSAAGRETEATADDSVLTEKLSLREVDLDVTLHVLG